MATCCLFLAGKVEETPKKVKDILKHARTYLESRHLRTYLPYFDDECIGEILTYEKILLQTVKFDLQVDHPYNHLLKYAKTLQGNQERIRSIVQMTWAFINDSFCTTLCLEWEPEIIAIALMYLSSKLTQIDTREWINDTDSVNWWDQFVQNLNVQTLEGRSSF